MPEKNSAEKHGIENYQRLETKSIASFEALQYRQDLLLFTTIEHTSLSIHVVQIITIIRVDKIRKSAV